MLSQEALRNIGNVDREATERRIHGIFERWRDGDVDGLLSYMAPDVVFDAGGQWSGIKAPLRGRNAVGALLNRYAEAAERIVILLHEIVIDGDRVVTHRTSVGRTRADGRRYQCDFISFFRFRDGLVVEFKDYPDAAWRDFGPIV